MKSKILISLSVLFALFAICVLITSINFNRTTAAFNHIVKLHQIEGLRHDLVDKILKVQSDVYSYHTPLGKDLGEIVEHVSALESSAKQCTSCHHSSPVAASLNNIQKQIQQFQNSLSFFITASANRERIEYLKRDAALKGNLLLHKTEELTFEASRRVKDITQKAYQNERRGQTFLLSALALFSLFGALVAIHLTRSVTGPVNDLVALTRKIAAGKLGSTTKKIHKSEFAELAIHLNAMSLSLKEGYEKLQQEIAERKQTGEALRESEERYSLAVLAANDGIWDWDLTNNTLYYSPRWKMMLGYTEAEIGNSLEHWHQKVHPDDLLQLKAQLTAHIDGHTSHFENQHRIMHRDGNYRWMLTRGIAANDASGKAVRMAGSQSDITEKRKTEEQLKHDAFHDALTNLPNRPLLLNRMEQILLQAKRRNDYLSAVLFLDLDRFKIVNDSLGHLVGDQLLIAVSQRLEGFVRPGDTVARLGGDEFAVLLDDIHSLEEAVQIAKRIQSELPAPFVIKGHEVFTTASIGIALSSRDYQNPEQFLRDADLAMYQAKANGKARFEIFDEAMHARTIRHLELETDLRRAIINQEFRLLYQPIYSLKTGRISGFEALLRWHHPDQGLILPDEFIPIAEETGLITQIGQWVVCEACTTAARWNSLQPDYPALTINLNLSGKEFTPQLPEFLKGILQGVDIDSSLVRLEITESTIMEAPETAAVILTRLKELGVSLEIDDFGTGYSSLSYLQNFPIDALKIDRSFVSQLHLKNENLEIVKTIINMAHNLNMYVIAEGVEDVAELKILADLKTEYIQGYLISAPVAAEDIPLLLADAKRA
jgi:diguanylate cyclase (GGDEF)-like protein/PAS domain S-box-containing protein